ncbi:MAG: cytochrome c oxidase subunit I [Actinomycetia bacterium]|nr:cytochrome c oxidase subunit I [Actinomycetes bacterium]MCP4226595.1 cytochrome c oxidase subunit I [Actinomycetes bacterium]MCP5032697.1 cytochrome c oxidase subunit I [Actinomycetes bacterium]
MRPLIQAIKGGVGGYLLGAFGAWILQGGGSMSDPVPVTFGFIFALIGWLMGIGVWNQWGREWFGLPVTEASTTGWTRYFQFSTDHKVIGAQYLVTFITVFLLGGVFALIIRLEMAGAGIGENGFMDEDTYNKVMSMHGILMVAVAVAGILGAFGNYLVPLMIGARDMAFPRLNALSFWLIPPVAVSLLSAPLLGSFEAGWTAYPPLSVLAPGDGQLLFNLGVIAFGLSSIFGGLNILTTVITMRAPGLTWGRLPIFVWAVFSASLLSVLITQFFAASLVLIHLDRIAGTTFFGAAAGGDALLYEHLFWFYSHPAVYIMVLPAFGVALEVITHFSRKPLFAYKAVVGAFLAIVGLSALVWAHHMFTSGMASYLHAPFMALTEAISIPTGVVFLAAIGTLWRGRIWFTTPLILAAGWVFNFMIGGLTGLFHADVATDIQLHDTYFVVAHFHFTIIGGSIFGLLAGTFYWFPKITGRMYNETVGRIFAVWVTLGLNLIFIPMFWVGVNGMNRRIAVYPEELQAVNRFISYAALFLACGFLLFAGNLLYSSRRGPKAPANPWNASTLEWMVSSPPPLHNFPLLPEVVGQPYPYGSPDEQHAELITDGGE